LPFPLVTVTITFARVAAETLNLPVGPDVPADA
jgi:hypothetical protein